MITCPNCRRDNLEGALFCQFCNKPLIDITTQETESPSSLRPVEYDPNAALVLHVRGATEPLPIPSVTRAVLGRYDNTSETNPDVDLMPFGAMKKGVSRLHAAIERGEDVLTVIDLGSANGTYINGRRLVENQPRILRDGDEIRLGRLITHLYVK